MAAAVEVPQDVIALAQEAEALRERLARKDDDPAARLTEIETALDRHWDRQAKLREQAEIEYQQALAAYGPLRDAADAATAALVAAVTAAVEARRKLEAARKRAGVAGPEKTSVRASRDRAFRELRQDAKLAAGASY